MKHPYSCTSGGDGDWGDGELDGQWQAQHENCTYRSLISSPLCAKVLQNYEIGTEGSDLRFGQKGRAGPVEVAPFDGARSEEHTSEPSHSGESRMPSSA